MRLDSGGWLRYCNYRRSHFSGWRRPRTIVRTTTDPFSGFFFFYYKFSTVGQFYVYCSGLSIVSKLDYHSDIHNSPIDFCWCRVCKRSKSRVFAIFLTGNSNSLLSSIPSTLLLNWFTVAIATKGNVIWGYIEVSLGNWFHGLARKRP